MSVQCGDPRAHLTIKEDAKKAMAITKEVLSGQEVKEVTL